MVRIYNQSPFKKLKKQPFRRLASAVWQAHQKDGCDLTITFVTTDAIVDLNQRYLQRSYQTDVISFNLGADPEGKTIGDIYICPEVARENAEYYGCSFEEELARLVIHGVLHVIGYDDATDTEREAMRRLENKFLEKYWQY
ncbi:MAG: rRNA maturation RNase YbeY [candidate division KSB1 bacterium]|nr:rRNA maturation RNase YbeY [candidate division KSB1 bacterium]MDQ7064568.1 rRNA maturation RNase YbeY [candidate division KSB1 bacterium]